MDGTTEAGTAFTPAAERILEVASRLFYKEGVRAIGVDTIVELSGVSKNTLYKHFGSKDELAAAFLRRRDERWRAWLKGIVEAEGDSARGKLLRIFDALEGWIDDEGFRGCAFVNVSELPRTRIGKGVGSATESSERFEHDGQPELLQRKCVQGPGPVSETFPPPLCRQGYAGLPYIHPGLLQGACGRFY